MAGEAGKSRSSDKHKADTESLTDRVLPDFKVERKNQLLQPGGDCRSGIAERARSPDLLFALAAALNCWQSRNMSKQRQGRARN